MITITYSIVLAEPRDTFVNRFKPLYSKFGTTFKFNDMEGEERSVSIMELSVNGKSVRLHSVSNPLTQYRNFGHR
jgi:hypothetical protein